MAKKGEKSDIWKVIDVMEPGRCLAGKSFSITGHLGLARDEVVRIIEQAGGRFEERPVSGVTYLVTNKSWNRGTTAEPNCSLKLRKAMDNGVKVIDEQQLIDMLVEGDRRVREGSGR